MPHKTCKDQIAHNSVHGYIIFFLLLYRSWVVYFEHKAQCWVELNRACLTLVQWDVRHLLGEDVHLQITGVGHDQGRHAVIVDALQNIGSMIEGIALQEGLEGTEATIAGKTMLVTMISRGKALQTSKSLLLAVLNHRHRRLAIFPTTYFFPPTVGG